MIPFDRALDIVLQNSTRLDEERIALENSLGRILAEDIIADRDMPPFNKSAVDGYACQDPSDGDKLKVLETIPAGEHYKYSVYKGACSKIMTGAEVPEGASWVVMVEDTRPAKDGFVEIVKKGRKSNIAIQGEDYKREDAIVPKGEIIKPQHIAILASVGSVNPLVYKVPSVNLITTGNELVEPDQVPGNSQIRNSNASQLRAQFDSVGIESHYEGIIGDRENEVLKVLNESASKFAITVLTGGVSMGDYDFVPDMMEKAGIEILFHKIAIKPGKPTIFGRKGKNVVIGLPGNPVSTFLQFELLLKPMLYKMMGSVYNPISIKLPAGEQIKSKKEKRDSWKPVQIVNSKVYPLNYHGSGHMHALYKADGFICIPAEKERIEKDTLINVRQI